MLQISTLQKNFDVDTVDIKERVVGSLTTAHIPEHFLGVILNGDGKSSDLYGPFWICMTLVMFVSVTANTSKFLHRDETVNDIEFDINHLFNSFAILLSYAFLLPTILYALITCILPTNANRAKPFTLVDLVALYGYSLVPYLIASLLCLIPSSFIEWVVLGAATGMSLLLILRNIAGPLIRYVHQSTQGQPYESGGNALEKLVGSFLMVLIGFHVVLFLIMKFTFYYHRGGGTGNMDNLDDDGMADGGTDVVASDDSPNADTYDDTIEMDDDASRWF